MEEWMQYARDMAKTEKELEIDPWVIISFYRTTEQGGKVLLLRYDLPRKVADKYDWVEGKTDLPISQRECYTHLLPV